MRAFGVLLVLGLCLITAAAGQERYLRPVDEASFDASFAAFRTRLIAAVERRDAAFIYSVLDPKIELSFGGDHGLADFKRIWKIERRNSKFWDEFSRVIRNGGTFDSEGGGKNNSFSAPYTFSSWPADLDGFDYAAIFGFDVNLREAPSADARVVDKLSYNLVKPNYERSKYRVLPGGDREFEWIKVETLGGKSGFVKAEFIRSSVDFRAGFVKKRGVWKMTYFLAGD